MRARPPARRRGRSNFAWTLQRLRLERIADGEMEPINDREEYFLRVLRMDGHADYRQFIVPRSILLLEMTAMGRSDD